MANFATDSDILEYEPQIHDYGIQDFSDLHAKSTADIERDLRITWWPKSTYGRYDITIGTHTEMNADLLTHSQFTRAAVFHVLAYWIYPRLSTFSPEGDIFREKISYYSERYREEFDKILRDGVEYDFDSSGTISDSEKQPTHFGRLVR